MGYFSNGTEGDAYFEDYCGNCVHDKAEMCPIWNAHLRFAYRANGKHDDAEAILNMLIPRSKDGLGNEACVMFAPKPAVGDLFDETERAA